MNKGLVLYPLYQDIDIVELSVTVSNGGFSGTTSLYVGHGALAEFATRIDGFPLSSDDSREFVLAAFGEGFAGGAARLRFASIDLAGHCILQVDLETEDGLRKNWPTQSVSMVAPIEAAAVDQFVVELRELDLTVSGKATLWFAE